MNILIVGKGKLAQAIAKQCAKENIPFSFWGGNNNSKSIVLYCGSARHAKEVVKFCTNTKSPLILLSTDVVFPKKVPFPLYPVPNSSTEVREFIKTVIGFARRTAYSTVSIIESHQSTKKDVSGTARLITKTIGESPKIITSIRSPKQQLALGISKKYLSGHAYHKIIFAHDGVTTEFSVLVRGREAYAKGALDIARQVAKGTFAL